LKLTRRAALCGFAAGSTGLVTGLSARDPTALPAATRRGVSLAGAEFGVRPGFCNTNPGRFGRDYTYNSERTVAYFADLGFTRLRIPFRWERLQPRLGGPLEPAELDRLRQVVGWAAKHGATVVLDVHNFGRYCLGRDGRAVELVIDQQVDGATPVSRDDFADLWRRLSEAFRRDREVEAYGLMNEPHDMGRSDWKAISRAAVTAVRKNGDPTLIFVPGNSYSNSEKLASVNGPTAWVGDDGGAVAYEAHCYLDADFSGRYARSYDDEAAGDRDLDNRGLMRLLPFAGWCALNRVRGVLGEFGVPGDPRWLRVLEPLLEALGRSGLDGYWWAAGDWWPPDDALSIQPRGDRRTPAPQVATLLRAWGRS